MTRLRHGSCDTLGNGAPPTDFLAFTVSCAALSLAAAPPVDRREQKANYEPASNVSWKSVQPSVPNNRQSKDQCRTIAKAIHKIAHKSNDRRMATSTAHPMGPSTRTPIAVSIKSVWRTLPRPGFTSADGTLQPSARTRLTLILASCWRACARS